MGLAVPAVMKNRRRDMYEIARLYAADADKARFDMASKKNRLIWAGVAAYTERGFHNTSVKEIAEAAGVPKGSFAYYFKTKDEFTISVIRAYSDYFCRKLDRILLDASRTPLQRISAFIEDAARGMERYQFMRGCLVGNLGQEITGLTDACRAELLATLGRWRQRVKNCLIEAQEAGELSQKLDTAAAARSFWYAWEGAVLGAKLERNRAPLEWVGHTFLERVKLVGDMPGEACLQCDGGATRAPDLFKEP